MQKEDAKLFWLGIPILFFAGSLVHFLYGLTGNLFVIGLIAPANESVFEHAKLFLLPALIWYGAVYLRRKKALNAALWFTAALLAIVTQIASMMLLYYFYVGAFGLHALAFDILIFLFSVIIAQSLALHCASHGKHLDHRLALFLLAALIVLFAILTVVPPHAPLFIDPITNACGIGCMSPS